MCSLFSCLFYTSLLIHAHRHNVNFLFRKSLVRLRSNQSELSVNTSKESYTIAFLSIQIDKYEISLLIVNSNTIILTAHTSYYCLLLWINMIMCKSCRSCRQEWRLPCCQDGRTGLILCYCIQYYYVIIRCQKSHRDFLPLLQLYILIYTIGSANIMFV